MSEKLNIDNRQSIFASEIKEVRSSNPKEVRLVMRDGTSATVEGEELKISSFSKDSGEIKIEGRVYAFKYGKKKEQFLKRVFK